MDYTAITKAAAAQSNKLPEVQFLHNVSCPWPLKLLEFAACKGYLELVRWCYEHGCSWEAGTISHYSSESGNVELMAWVLQQPGTRLYEGVMEVAALYGHTAMCQYLHTQQYPSGLAKLHVVLHIVVT
jgi:hypothetical protein